MLRHIVLAIKVQKQEDALLPYVKCTLMAIIFECVAIKILTQKSKYVKEFLEYSVIRRKNAEITKMLFTNRAKGGKIIMYYCAMG